MANGLVKLVQTAGSMISLVALLSCNSPSGPNYSNTPMIPERNADVAGSVILTPEDSYALPIGQTQKYDPCQDGSFRECLSNGIYELTRFPDRLLH